MDVYDLIGFLHEHGPTTIAELQEAFDTDAYAPFMQLLTPLVLDRHVVFERDGYSLRSELGDIAVTGSIDGLFEGESDFRVKAHGPAEASRETLARVWFRTQTESDLDDIAQRARHTDGVAHVELFPPTGIAIDFDSSAKAHDFASFLQRFESAIDEVSPPGFKGTVKAMKRKHPEIDNPYALAWHMYKKGATSNYKADGTRKDEGVPTREQQKEYDRLSKMSLTALQGILRRLEYDGPKVKSVEQAVDEIMALRYADESVAEASKKCGPSKKKGSGEDRASLSRRGGNEKDDTHGRYKKREPYSEVEEVKGDPKIGQKVRLGTVVWVEPENQRKDKNDPHVDIKPKQGGAFIRRVWSAIKESAPDLPLMQEAEFVIVHDDGERFWDGKAWTKDVAKAKTYTSAKSAEAEDIDEGTVSSMVGGFRRAFFGHKSQGPYGFSRGGPGGGAPLNSPYNIKGKKHHPKPPVDTGDVDHAGGNVSEVSQRDLHKANAQMNALISKTSNKRDRENYEEIADLLSRGMIVAAKKAARRLDSAPRDDMPDFVWFDVLGFGESIEEGYQHVHWKGSKSLRFKVTMPGGKKKTVQGRTFGKYIGIHMNNKTRQWTATHMPSGLAVAYTEFDEEKLIRKVKQAEVTLGDKLDFDSQASIPDEHRDEVMRVLGGIRKGLRESVDERAGKERARLLKAAKSYLQDMGPTLATVKDRSSSTPKEKRDYEAIVDALKEGIRKGPSEKAIPLFQKAALLSRKYDSDLDELPDSSDRFLSAYVAFMRAEGRDSKMPLASFREFVDEAVTEFDGAILEASETYKGWKLEGFKGAVHLTRPGSSSPDYVIRSGNIVRADQDHLVRANLYHGVADQRPVKRGEIPSAVLARAKKLIESESVDEADPVIALGALGSVAIGAGLGVAAVRALRAIRASLKRGKKADARKEWDKLSKKDQQQLQALLSKHEGLDEVDVRSKLLAIFAEEPDEHFRASDLADRLGMPTPVVVKTLSRLVNSGALQFERGKGYIQDPKALRIRPSKGRLGNFHSRRTADRSGRNYSNVRRWEHFSESTGFNVEDRYDVLQIDPPEPEHACDECEGTGLVPINLEGLTSDDPERTYYERAWKVAEAKEFAEDGWHFLVCPECSGSGVLETLSTAGM